MPYPPNVPNGSYGPRGPLPPSFPWGGMMQAPPMIPKLYWDAYSDEQRFKTLWQCFDQMADRVNQLGYYYVPDFRGEWSARQEYPPMSVVEAPSGIGGVTAGDSYTALDWVPAGTPLTDERYWAKTGNYNAQIDALQQMVEGYDARIAEAESTADSALEVANGKAPTSHASSGATYGLATPTLNGHTKLYQTVATQTDGAVTPDAVKTYVDEVVAGIEPEEKPPAMVVVGDSWSSNTGLWENVAKKLGYTLHNYAVSGTGFIQGSSNFVSQINSAASEHAEDNVVLVCVYGISNDYSNGYDEASMFETPLSSISAKIASTWPDAASHVFFNSRLKYGSSWIDNGKMNKQLSLARALGSYISASTVMTAHVDSMCWIGHDYYASDFVHPNATAYGSYLPAYLANSLAGGSVDYYQTNRQLVNLSGNNGSGNVTLSYTPYEIQIIAYLNLTENFEQAAQPFTLQPADPLQVAIWQDDRASNQTGISIVKTNGTGSGNMPVQFKPTSTGDDKVYLSRICDNPSVPVVTGTYGGVVRARIWS